MSAFEQPFLESGPVTDPFAARANPFPGYRKIDHLPTPMHGTTQILRVAVDLPDSLKLPPLALRTPRGDIRHPEALAAFVEDWRTLSRVSHPNLIEVTHLHPGDGREQRPFVVTPWYDGGDLAARVRRGLTPLALIGILDAIVQALIAVREVVGPACVNHAISPDHILFDSADRPLLAAYAGRMAYVAPAGALPPFPRNPRFTSPEHVRGEPPGPGSDIYSLGAVACFGLTGQPPFQGADLAIRQQHLYAPVPVLSQCLPSHEALDGWQDFLARTLAKRAAQRFPSLEAVRDALAELRERVRIQETPRAASGLAHDAGAVDRVEAPADDEDWTAVDLLNEASLPEPPRPRWWPAVLALVLAATAVLFVIASLMPPPGQW